MTKLSDAARALGEQPAFPMARDTLLEATGLTKREYFIGQALAGVSGRQYDYPHGEAQGAIFAADAILEALASEQQPEQPKADDGWIEWKGGECPVDRFSHVEVKLRSGAKFNDISSRFPWRWLAGDDLGDIIAYRIVTPAKPEPSRDLRTVAGGGTLMLEVGKTYRDREGDVRKITNYEPSEEDPFVDASGETYTEDGFWDHPYLKSNGDLIELVEGE